MEFRKILGISVKHVAAALALGTTFVSSSAHAVDSVPEAHKNSASGDLYWWSAKGIGSAIGLVPALQLELASNVYLNARLPIAANIDGFDDTTRFGLGNPTASVHYAISSDKLTWYVGGRASLPLVGIIDSADQELANLLAGSAMTLYDPYLWTSNLPISGIGGVEAHVAEPLFVRAELSPGFFIPLHDRSGGLVSDDKVHFVYQFRGEAEGRAESGWGGGGAIQFLHVPTSDGDNAQSALEGFGSYDDGKLFARLGLLLALDSPLGFGFDKGKVATAHFRIGGYL